MTRKLGTPIIKLLGMRTQGDVGGLTIYQSKRHQLVWFPQAPPKNPPSSQQRRQRAKWRAAARAWRRMAADDQASWARAARRAKLPISGYAFFVAIYTTHDWRALATIERCTRIPLIQTIGAIG
jgi:hypothetical protein